MLIAIFVIAGLLESAWCQSPQLKTAADLVKYLGTDRERLLFDGAIREDKLVWHTSLSSYKEVARK